MRRTKEQVKADKVIKQRLLILGEVINQQAKKTSRRDLGRLQDEQNYRVFKDTNLVMTQVHYGKYNYPLGKNSGEKNALLIAVNEHVPEQTNILVTDLLDVVLKPFKK